MQRGSPEFNAHWNRVIKERIAARKAAGLCAKCGKAPAREGRAECPECAEKSAHKARMRQSRLKQTPEEAAAFRATQNDRTKRLYRERVDAGICTNCGKSPRSESNKALCEECRIRELERYQQNKETRLLRHKEYYYTHLTESRAYHHRRNAQAKREAMDAYGSICQCCGESHIAFLTLDHVNNDGFSHREMLAKELGRPGGLNFYRYLKTRGFPNDPPLQVLCLNCNSAKRISGVCPHQEEAAELEPTTMPWEALRTEFHRLAYKKTMMEATPINLRRLALIAREMATRPELAELDKELHLELA